MWPLLPRNGYADFIREGGILPPSMKFLYHLSVLDWTGQRDGRHSYREGPLADQSWNWGHTNITSTSSLSSPFTPLPLLLYLCYPFRTFLFPPFSSLLFSLLQSEHAIGRWVMDQWVKWVTFSDGSPGRHGSVHVDPWPMVNPLSHIRNNLKA